MVFPIMYMLIAGDSYFDIHTFLCSLLHSGQMSLLKLADGIAEYSTLEIPQNTNILTILVIIPFNILMNDCTVQYSILE